MALVVITILDSEDGNVELQAMFEPEAHSELPESLTRAQSIGLDMLAVLNDKKGSE